MLDLAFLQMSDFGTTFRSLWMLSGVLMLRIMERVEFTTGWDFSNMYCIKQRLLSDQIALGNYSREWSVLWSLEDLAELCLGRHLIL